MYGPPCPCSRLSTQGLELGEAGRECFEEAILLGLVLAGLQRILRATDREQDLTEPKQRQMAGTYTIPCDERAHDVSASVYR
jgi:hypothetical protein